MFKYYISIDDKNDQNDEDNNDIVEVGGETLEKLLLNRSKPRVLIFKGEEEEDVARGQWPFFQVSLYIQPLKVVCNTN